MTKIDKQENGDESRPLALHIRARRQWYGKLGISQADLARLSGVPLRQLQRYETARELPDAIATLLKICFALRVPLLDLIAQDLREEIEADIEARRVELKFASPDDGYHEDEW